MNPYYYGTAQNVGVPQFGQNYGMYQPTMQPQPQYQQYQNNQPTQQSILPLTFVNSIDEVNRYIVPINQSIYFRLNNANKIYLKSTDIKGVSTIEEFDLISSKTAKAQESNSEKITDYATKDDLNALANALKDFRTIILDDIKTLLNGSKNDLGNGDDVNVK